MHHRCAKGTKLDIKIIKKKLEKVEKYSKEMRESL